MKSLIRRELLGEEDYILPVVEGLPQTIYSKVNYVHSVMAMNAADTELSVKKVLDMTSRASMKTDLNKLVELKRDIVNEFISANKGIGENKAAVHRLLEKISEYQHQRSKLEDQIKSVKDEIIDYKTVESEMNKYVQQYSMFEQFLSGVADTSEMFNSVGDVLNRYETLESSRHDIAELLQKELDGATVIRRNMLKLVEEKATSLKKHTNKLILLQVASKEAKERRAYWETKIEKIKTLTERSKEEGIVLQGACGDIYRRVCKSLRHYPTISDGNIKQQIKYVEKGVAYLKDVYSIGLALKEQQVDSKSRSVISGDSKVASKPIASRIGASKVEAANTVDTPTVQGYSFINN